jgi:hypothetical protein
MRVYFVCLFLLVNNVYPSEPSVDSVDYSNPARYLEIKDSLGDRNQIISHALKLKGDSDISTMRNVLNWMDQNLKYDANRAYSWRNFDDAIKDGTYGGCADQGIICGVLLKAAGIPVIWIKTMDVSWIWDFKKGRKFESWSGHVFLEVYLDGKWMLLDPGTMLIYMDYSPKARILPGNRFAYHKGNDPKEMIMSLQWEQWKVQTSKYFRDLDVSLLPVDSEGGTSFLPRAYVIGNSPYYQAISQTAKDSGFAVAKSFNTNYEENLPLVKGNILLIETHDNIPIISINELEKFFPDASKGLQNSDGIINIRETTIVFIDFSKQLKKININE